MDCTIHRRPKLTIPGVILRFFFFFFFFLLLCELSAKRDMGHTLYYLTIELDHAKRDSRPAAFRGVVLQRFEGLNLYRFVWEHNGFAGKVNSAYIL